MTATEGAIGTGAMWVVDDDLIAHVARCIPSEAVAGPDLDIEIIAEPELDLPETESEDLVSRAVERMRALRRPLARRRPARLTVSLGDPVVDGRSADAAVEVWTEVLEAVRGNAAVLCVPASTTSAGGLLERYAANPRSASAEGTIVASVMAVTEHDESTELAAHVVVVGLPAGADVARAQAFVHALATHPAVCNLPLYVVGVGAGVDRLTATARWRGLRTSVALVAPGSTTDVVAVGRTPLGGPRVDVDVAIVPCPTFRAGTGTPGLTRIRVDTLQGQTAISIHHDLGSDVDHTAVRFIRELASASRVTSGELRLYRHVRSLIADGIETLAAGGKDTKSARAFLDSVVEEWDRTGYVTLCRENGDLGLPAVRTLRYLLLVVLRERADGGYDLLLSNHSPIRDSQLAEWNTVLLPAFQYPYTLLGHLRDDVIRQAAERAEDLSRAEHAEGFEEAVSELLRSSPEADELIWADEVREIATTTVRKISPTTGFVTEYEYHLVTLLPLIDRRAASSGTDGDPTGRVGAKIIAWLDDLDEIRPDAEVADSPRVIDLRALQADGAGVRFDPAAELVADPGLVERARARKLPPGAIWFPVDARGPAAPWRTCPSIRARNADVMAWVDKVLDQWFDKSTGRFPNDLVLGRFAGSDQGYEIEESYEFDDGRRWSAETDGEIGSSTCDALSRVRFAAASDLRDRRPYADSAFERVYLVRHSVGALGRDRDAILVVKADVFDALDSRDDLDEREHALGRLRPVQRYVLSAGLVRAREIEEQVVAKQRAAGNAWGFVRVRHGGVRTLVSITPPIVERLHVQDWGERGEREFVLCDGNHRVVQTAWNLGEPVAAVLVESPSEPYYARPFGDLEWGDTAGTELPTTPSQDFKYVARAVLVDDVPADHWPDVEAILPKNRFRRYYRDLNSGFGNVGGQGGRWAG